MSQELDELITRAHKARLTRAVTGDESGTVCCVLARTDDGTDYICLKPAGHAPLDPWHGMAPLENYQYPPEATA